MNKTLTRSALALAVLASASFAVHADEEESPLTGSIGIVSDYQFDGVTQTDNGAALQAGLTYTTPVGIYIGAWASNVDFGTGTDSNVETDWYVGYGFGGESVSFDVGVTKYKYVPGGDDIDYLEEYFGVTFSDVSIKWFHTSDYAGGGEKADRIKFNYSIAINDAWSIPLEYNKWKAKDAFQDYSGFKVGVATTVGEIAVELDYVKTNLDDNAYNDDGTVAEKGAYEDAFYTSGGFILSLNKSF